MGQRCARRIVSAGFANIAKGNVFGDFEDWLDSSLWPELVSTTDDTMTSPMEIDISTQARASSLRYDIGMGVVKEVKKLTNSWRARQVPFGGTATLGNVNL